MHGANGRVFCISKFAMIQNDFVMLIRRLIRSSTAWLYSFLFHIHRIAIGIYCFWLFDWHICTKEPSNANKQVIFGYESKELSAFTNVGLQSTRALITSGNKQHLGFHGPRALPKSCPQKNRPGKLTWVKITIGGRNSYVVRSPGRELECFFLIQKWWAVAESTYQEFEGRWNMFILRKKFAPENVRAWFSMFSPVMQVTLDVIFNILCGIWDTLMIWTNPIAR